jgi:hypothetical protein
LNQIKIKSESSLSSSSTVNVASADQAEPIDWKPQDNCYFCVDGKLLKVNEIGELVAEAGPVQPETELNKHVSCKADEMITARFTMIYDNSSLQIVESDDSSSSSDAVSKPLNPTRQHLAPNHLPKNLEALLKSIAVDSNMTSFDLAAAQIAAFQRIPELNQLNPFYSSMQQLFCPLNATRCLSHLP